MFDIRRPVLRMIAAAVLLLVAVASSGATLPTGFTDSMIARPDGQPWDDAVGLTFAADGRLFVWERAGRVWLIDASHPHATPLIDLSAEVGAYGELGLTGFALDPAFAANGRIYLFYTVDPQHLASCDSPRQGAPVCHAAARGDAHGPFSATISRITRYTLAKAPGATDYRQAGSVEPSSRVVLLGESAVGAHNDTGCVVTATVHGAGSLAFGNDGTLLASCGDGASDVSDDMGAAPGTDYAAALSKRLMSAADNVGAFRSQRVDSLSGKVLRLDPATGNGLDSNPFFDGNAPRAARSRVWVLGLRNPERFAVRPDSGSTAAGLGDPGTLYIGDAGRYAWESLDVARSPRLNFGWPLFEGMNSDSVSTFNSARVYDADARNPLYPGACRQPQLAFRDLIKQDTHGAVGWPNPCRAAAQLPASMDLFLHTRPAIDWLHGRLARWSAFDTDGSAIALPLGQHAANGVTVAGPLFGGSHSVGGTWYLGSDFPAALRNVYFHADAGAGWIKAFTFDANDNPIAVQDFIDGAGAVRALAAAPGGGLYFVAMTAGTTVHRIRYQAPAIASSSGSAAPPTSGHATLSPTTGTLLAGHAATSAASATTASAVAAGLPRALVKLGTAASVQGGALTGTDVGGVTIAGVYGYTAPTYSISGAGSDVWGVADAFQFYQAPLTGDGSITARVATDSAPDPWTKAGVMIRETLAAGASNAFVAITGGNGAVMQYRAGTANASTSLQGPATVGAPYWVRLARNGNVFTGAVSADGLTWTQIGQFPLTLATQTYVGLAMTSHSTSAANTSFDSLSIVTAPAAPAGLSVTASGTSAVLSWSAATAGSNGIGGYYVYRNGSTTPLATVTAGTTYTDAGLNPAGNYSYQIAAFDKTAPTPFVSPLSGAVSYVAPGAPSAPTALTVGAVTATSVALSWTASTAGVNGLGGYYVYRNNSGTPFAVVTSGTGFVDATVGPNTTYTYQVSAFDKTTPTPIVSARSAAASATTLATLPSGQTWTGTDIGTTGIPGSFSIGGSQIVVNGGGADIWQAVDAFQFVSQPFNGNGTITARVVSETNTNAWTKAGVMIRETLGAGATNAFVAVTPGNGAVFQARATTGATSVSTSGPAAGAPYWVRLNRTGNVFTGYTSLDGATWTQVTQYTITMASNAYVGLALTSHTAGVLATAAFDSITLSGGGLLAPSTPNGLASSAISASSVTLNWTASVAGTNPLSGYYVYRNGSSTPIATVAGTTYTDTSVSPATTYSYSIAAFDCSTPAPLVSASTAALPVTTAVATATPPLPPASLTASAASTSAINLSWSASTAGSNGIGGYYVYRNSGSTPVATVTSGTSYTDTGLTAATNYSYRIAAFDKTTPTPLVSSLSTAASATTLAAVSAPAAPTALAASALSASSIGLSWTASTAGSNGIGGYYVYRNGGTTPVATVTTGTSYTDSGLAASTTYSYQVAAFDKTTPTPLVSALSTAASATTPAAASAPSAPTGLGAASVGSTSVTLSWTASTAGSNGIGGYYLYRNGATTPTATITTGTTYTDSGLAASTTYSYQVAAFDKTTPTPLVSALSTPPLSVTTATGATQTWSGGDIGTTDALGSYSISGSSIIVNGAGADIYGTADAFQFVSQPLTGDGTITARVTSESATNAWTKAGVMFRETLAAGSTHTLVAVTPGNGAIIESRTATNGASTSIHGPLVTAPYWVRLNRTGNVFTGYVSPDGNTWTQIGQYTFTMASSAYVGLGVTSHVDGVLATATFDSITVSGPGGVAPAAPTGLTSSAISASSVTLGWTASTAGSNPVAGYYVYRNGGTTPIATVTSGTSYTDATLAAATTYTYNVAAFDTSTPTPLVSPRSATLSVTSSGGAATAPGTPTGLAASALSASSIGLSWTASTAGSNGIGGYYVYRNGGTTPVATVTTGTSYTDSGLAASTTYSYQVAAFDKTTPAPLVSALSAAAGATTSAGSSGGGTAPSAPTGLTASATTDYSITLSWTASAAGSTPVGGYLVYRNGGTTPVGATTATSYTDSGLTTATNYTYTVVAYDTTSPTALLSQPSATLNTATTPIVFSDADVGATGATGSAAASAGVYTVSGSGADIWATADAFNFDSQSLTGDGTITARVVSQTNTNTWAKAGVMIRDTLATGSLNALVAVTPGNGAVMQYRPTANAASVSIALSATITAPYWVRLNRAGNVFTGYASPDGNTWTQVSQTTLAMGTTVYVGLAVSSHSAGAISTATFDSVSVVATPQNPSAFALSPRNAGITLQQTQQFTASLYGIATTAVTWKIDGVLGGNATVGTISPTGLYTPPATSAGGHTISVASNVLPALSVTGHIGVTDLAGVYTYHEDQARTGQNTQEYALTSSTVAPATFGKLFNCTVDGDVYAQPLYAANVHIGGGVHNVVFVVTMHDSVYAFDADNPSCVNYWTTAYATTTGTVTSVPTSDTPYISSACPDISTEYGITGTPVIDPVASVIYFVTKTKESGAWFQRLHALDLATGAEKPNSPTTINASVLNKQGGTLTFDPLWDNQRPGLALVNGQVYIGWASHCDANAWHGWLIAYNASTLQQTAVFNSTPSGAGGGIWMSGGAPAADQAGNLYVTTGNGSFDYTSAVVPPLAAGTDVGESYVKLSLTTTGSTSKLAVADFYTPSQNAAWTSADLDISASGVVVLPDGVGPAAHPNLVTGSDKQGHMWMLDRSTPVSPSATAMGGFNPNSDQVVQYVTLPTAGASCTPMLIQGTPTYWAAANSLYIAIAGSGVMAIPLQGGMLPASGGVVTPSRRTAEIYGYPAPTPVISSTPGSTSAILWALDNNANGTDNCQTALGPAILRAYDASTLATLYSSALQVSDTAGNAIKFQLPIVANGHVYVAGSHQLTVYGLLP